MEIWRNWSKSWQLDTTTIWSICSGRWMTGTTNISTSLIWRGSLLKWGFFQMTHNLWLFLEGLTWMLMRSCLKSNLKTESDLSKNTARDPSSSSNRLPKLLSHPLNCCPLTIHQGSKQEGLCPLRCLQGNMWEVQAKASLSQQGRKRTIRVCSWMMIEMSKRTRVSLFPSWTDKADQEGH